MHCCCKFAPAGRAHAPAGPHDSSAPPRLPSAAAGRRDGGFVGEHISKYLSVSGGSGAAATAVERCVVGPCVGHLPGIGKRPRRRPTAAKTTTCRSAD